MSQRMMVLLRNEVMRASLTELRPVELHIK